MPPTRPGVADGPHSQQPAAQPPPPASASAVTSPRRRQRVDSSSQRPSRSSLAAPDPKRVKPSPAETPGSRSAGAHAAATMSVRVPGKQPEVVDLTSGGGGHRKGFLSPPSAFQPHTGARKLVIKNLRVAPNRAEEVQRYYARTWTEIEEALAAMFAGTAPRQPLERLYRGVEDLCLHGQASQLYQRLRTLCEAHLLNTVLGQIRSETRGADYVEVLRVVHRHWLVWSKQLTLIRSTFSYLDRAYLVNERGLLQINDLLISRFRKMVFDGCRRVNDAGKRGSKGQAEADDSGPAAARNRPGREVLMGMCQLVEQDRSGDAAFDAQLLREAVRMVHVFNVYNSHFEPVFLVAAEAYLRDFAQERGAAADLRQYVHACEALLRREDERCNAFSLDSSTKKHLRGIAEHLLIADRAAKLLDAASVAQLLDAGDAAAVKALYELLRLPRLHKRLRAPWEAYIEAAGRAIVTDVRRGDEMVVRLLLLRRSLDLLVRDAFARDDAFVFGLREAFGRFVNDRSVASAWASGTNSGGGGGAAAASKVGEMIAKYLDMLLRGGLKTLPPALLSDARDRADAERSGQASTGDEDAELDRQLDQGLELFRFIQGKDVFEAFYKKDLARRLLMGRSASQDAERNMLAKLKTECGASLTHNLEQMFRDQELSRDEMAAFQQWLDATDRGGQQPGGRGGSGGSSRGIDLQVSVLSAAAWPSYPDVALNLPPEVLEQVNRFDAFYKTKHTGRTLTWTHALGQCVVKARFPRGAKELLVSSFQAAVLLLFNEGEGEGGDGGDGGDGALSYAQIAEATGLAPEHLDRTLQSLACGKVRVLAKHPKGRDVGKTDTFRVNRAFADPKFRIKINQIQLKETKEENDATYERVAADRQFETQAAIVRIMKSRKALGHAQLVAEVISQTQRRGALDPADIKQNIEKLIDKDYLERQDDKYVYLA